MSYARLILSTIDLNIFPIYVSLTIYIIQNLLLIILWLILDIFNIVNSLVCLHRLTSERTDVWLVDEMGGDQLALVLFMCTSLRAARPDQLLMFLFHKTRQFKSAVHTRVLYCMEHLSCGQSLVPN